MVGIWVPLWKSLPSLKRDKSTSRTNETNASHQGTNTSQTEKENGGYGAACLAGLLLGSAMVARGEIGLLIIEIGYNATPYVSEEGFISAVWAILLNTIIGPVTVGYLAKFWGTRIGEGEWGVQKEKGGEGGQEVEEAGHNA